MMRPRHHFAAIVTLALLLLLVVTVHAQPPDLDCIAINKITGLGLLKIDSGVYEEQAGLRTYTESSPNGQYTLQQLYAETDASSTIAIYDATTGQLIHTLNGAIPPLSSPRWTADNHRLAFLSSHQSATQPAQTRLHVIEIFDNTVTMQVQVYDNTESGYLSGWSADGLYLDVTLTDSLGSQQSVFYSAADHTSIPFPSGGTEMNSHIWAGSGHQLALLSETAPRELLLIDPQQGIVSSTSLPLSVSFPPKLVYSPDGRHLAISGNLNCDTDGQNCDSGTVMVSADGKNPQVLPGALYAVPDFTALWSGSDSTRLALQPAQSPPSLSPGDSWLFKDLLAYHLDSGASEVVQANLIVPNYLTPIPSSYSGASANYFSPDSKRIFTMFEDEGKVSAALAKADGTNRQIVVDKADTVHPYNSLNVSYPCTACRNVSVGLGDPVWIGDRLLVKWSDDGVTNLTWIRADGSERHDLLDIGDIEDMGVLPGLNRLVYLQTATGTLFMVNLESGEQHMLYDPKGVAPVEASFWYVVLSPDQQWGVLRTTSGQYLFDLDTLKLRPINPYVAGPSWSPDSQSVAFLTASSTTGDIAVEIISPDKDDLQTFPARKSEFFFPREFVSRGSYLSWVRCTER